MSAPSELFVELPAASPSRRIITPLGLFISLGLSIFLAEITAMFILYYIQLPSYVLSTLLDSAIMLSLIFPALYVLQLKPILAKVKEQEKAETALRTNEANLKKILEALPVGVWLVDNKGAIIQGNPAGQEIWGGIRYVEMNGYVEYKGRWAKTGEVVKVEEWGAARAISRGEVSKDEEVNIEAFDGTQKVILNSAVPLYDEKNRILGAVVVNQDITLRRRMENERDRANKLMERYFNGIHTMIAYLDRDFNFIRVNQAYAAGAGHPADYFKGKNHFALYPNEENETIFRNVLEIGEPFIVFEKPFEYPDFPERGVTYWDWSVQPVMGPDDRAEGLVFSLIDVTRRKLAELQLERQNQELRQLTYTEHRQRVLAEGLVQSTIALNTSLELDQVLSSVMEQTRKAIPFEGADILLIEGDHLRMSAFLGFENYPSVCSDLENVYAFDNYPLLPKICSSLQMLILDSVHEHPCWLADTDLAWVRSFAVVPLIVDNSVMGIIELYDERQAAFDEDTAERLAAFAAPAALAIHHARIYKAELEARQVAETMRVAALALSQTLDLEHVINTLLDHIHMLVSCDTLGLTFKEGEDRWTLRAMRGYNAWADQRNIPSAPVEEISGVPGTLMHQGVLIVKNKALDARQVGEPGPEQIHTWAILPIIINEKPIGFVEIGQAGRNVFRAEQMQWAEALILEASVAIQNAWLFEQVRSSSIRLQSLARKLVELQEKERYHIARELHDEAGQVLSLLKLNLAQLEEDPHCPAKIRRRLLDFMKITDNVLEDLHRLAMDLRPVALDHLGLIPALQQLANAINTQGLSVKMKAMGMDSGRLPPDIETSLYRIVQEGLTNVLHHANASSVGILLERSGGKIKLFIEDDGIGFAPDQVEVNDQLGLVGMRERAEMFGGNLTIESSSGNGTSIIVEVPDAGPDSYHG